MSMSTATDWLAADDDVDPDTLKVPESPEHRRIVDAIGIVAARELLPHTVVYRDMNWYPPDAGTAVAPDLMTLPSGLLSSDAKSYRQANGDMPFPGAVIEIPSRTDSFDGLRAKSARFNALGVDVYIISVDPVAGGALRRAPGSTDFVTWTGKPIAPLGGLCIEMTSGRVAVRTPQGLLISTDAELLGMMAQAEASAQAQAAEANERAAEAYERAAMLEAKLRALGVEP